MKVFERVVLIYVHEQAADYIDPCQFVYRRNRGAEDAILHVLNTIYSHLEISPDVNLCGLLGSKHQLTS